MLLVHCHIPKCAGTSLTNVFEQWHGPRAIHTDPTPAPFRWINAPYYGDAARVLSQLPPAAVRALRVLSGHFPLPAIGALATEAAVQTVVILRDPVDRVRSLYDYVRGSPEHRLHRGSASFSLWLHAVLSSPDAPRVADTQTRYLTTCGLRPDPIDAATGELAVEILRTLTFVGIATRFDELVAALGAAGHGPVVAGERANATAQRTILSAADAELVRDANPNDCRLYEVAQELRR